ncbi:MAG: hypothetical protein N2Z22_11480 [Turneriella sp.]|nr:hypothetical protein [Turneriella sp.]
MKTTIACITIAVAALTMSNCRSVDKTKIAAKDAIVATQVAPVIFGAIGASAQDCLDALSREGVTEVKSVNGMNENFLISRLSSLELCQATGTK